MLFRAEILEGIAAGRVTAAFRRWRRATVREGGTLRTPVGVLSIDEIRPVDEADITAADARAAGASSVDALLEELRRGSQRGGALVRIAFHLAGPDPRHQLRERVALADDEARDLVARVSRLGIRSAEPGYGIRLLRLLDENPGTPSRRLAEQVARPVDGLKRDVRVLKELGLTESLGTGYRLSPRGRAVLGHIAVAGARE